MPIYEYECGRCHHRFDVMQKISDAPVEQCSKCLEKSARRLISAAGFQLKGDGWYATDFKNKSSKSSKDASGKSEEQTKQAKPEKNTSATETASVASQKESTD